MCMTSQIPSNPYVVWRLTHLTPPNPPNPPPSPIAARFSPGLPSGLGGGSPSGSKTNRSASGTVVHPPWEQTQVGKPAETLRNLTELNRMMLLLQTGRCRCYYVDVCRCYVDLRSGLHVPVDLHNQSTGCNNRVWTNWASQPQEAANPQPFWAAPRSRKVSRTVASGSVAIHRLAPRHWPKQRSGSRYFWPCPVADFQPPRSRHWGANAARWQWLLPRGGTSLEVQIPVVLYMFISKSTGCSAQKKVENIENEHVSE